jgi:hypothetical protein
MHAIEREGWKERQMFIVSFPQTKKQKKIREFPFERSV